MKIFLDANILISVINKEYPLFTISSRILSLSGHPRFQVFTSPICLAITFYFAEKKQKSTALKKIQLLCDNLLITDISPGIVKKVVENKKITDFEDGLEYYAALEAGCKCIITEDTGDFHFADCEVLNSDHFFMKYMAKQV